MTTRGIHTAGGLRRHPPAKVGDRLGVFEVVDLADRDRTSNERVRVRCARGHERTVYVFNARKSRRCPECHRSAPWTVGALRRAIAGLPASMDVVLEIMPAEGDCDLVQASLHSAKVEERCDEVERLYLYGDGEEPTP